MHRMLSNSLTELNLVEDILTFVKIVLLEARVKLLAEDMAAAAMVVADTEAEDTASEADMVEVEEDTAEVVMDVVDMVVEDMAVAEVGTLMVVGMEEGKRMPRLPPMNSRILLLLAVNHRLQFLSPMLPFLIF
jgi:hypothetical protein